MNPTALAWANNDERILYYSNDISFDFSKLVVFNVKDKLEEISLEMELVLDALWSPDSRWIAVRGRMLGVEEGAHIYLLDVDSGDIQHLTNHEHWRSRRDFMVARQQVDCLFHLSARRRHKSHIQDRAGWRFQPAIGFHQLPHHRNQLVANVTGETPGWLSRALRRHRLPVLPRRSDDSVPEPGHAQADLGRAGVYDLTRPHLHELLPSAAHFRQALHFSEFLFARPSEQQPPPVHAGSHHAACEVHVDLVFQAR